VGRHQQDPSGYAIYLPVTALKQVLMAHAGVNQASNGPKISHKNNDNVIEENNLYSI
jgi:hypothetical protein